MLRLIPIFIPTPFRPAPRCTAFRTSYPSAPYTISYYHTPKKVTTPPILPPPFSPRSIHFHNLKPLYLPHFCAILRNFHFRPKSPSKTVTLFGDLLQISSKNTSFIHLLSIYGIKTPQIHGFYYHIIP